MAVVVVAALRLEEFHMAQTGQFGSLVNQLATGAIDRRQFMEAAGALGVAGAVALFSANAALAGPGRNGFALYQGQDGTPAASPAAGAAASFPAKGMENKKRGQDGDLNILQWQAVTLLLAHRATGTKDFMAADLVNEPLMRYMPDATLGANLITEVPSVENGMLAKDLSTVTFKLKKDVLWSDGQPFTAKDVAFTWRWIMSEGSNSISRDVWKVIKSIEAVDDLTAKVTYSSPSATWFDPFTGGNNGHILPSHLWNDNENDTKVADAFQMKPIGTGPFKLESFTPNDNCVFVMNENYREPNKPAFARITIKGGGDAAAAARAVLSTGEYDFAWNLQIEPEVAKSMTEKSDAPGQLVVAPGTQVERLHFNFTDPNKEVDGQKSEINTPHPFFTDKAVRDAINMAIPRDEIATRFYIAGQDPTPNILTGVPGFTSRNTTWEFDLEKAKKVLDDAGWKQDGDTRKKDGVELKFSLVTTVNAVRQKTQAVVKQNLEKIGFKVELKQVDAGIFFDSSAGNDQNFTHMYYDMNMYTNNPTSSVPISYMVDWYAGKDNKNVCQKSNSWAGNNRQRYINHDYDALFEQLQGATDLDSANQILIKMNDLLIADRVIVPLVGRSADTYAISKTLEQENIAIGPGFEYDYWNIANWNRKA